jgi:hypothetical protein
MAALCKVGTSDFDAQMPDINFGRSMKIYDLFIKHFLEYSVAVCILDFLVHRK